MKLRIVLSAALVFAVGCSKDSKSSSDAPLEISPAFRQKVKSAQPLTPELHEEAKAALALSSKVLPDIELVVGDLSVDEAAKAVAKLNDDGRTNLQRIQKDCTAQKGSERTVMSEGEGVGSSRVVSKEHSVAGAPCPVSMKEITTTSTLLKSLDAKKRTGSLDVRIETETDSKVVDTELRKKTGVHQLASSSTAKIKMVDIAADQGEGALKSGYASYEGASRGEYKLENGKTLPLQMEMAGYRTTTKKEFAIIMTVKFAKGDLQISIFGSDDKVERFVNGQPATSEEIYEDYGLDLDDEIKGL